MSGVRGTISVDVAFTDSTTVGGALSLKTITLRDATEYTTGKVAVVTGTCGTGGVSITPTSPGYLNAAGESVALSSIVRVAFQSPEGAFVSQGLSTFLRSRGDVCVDNLVGVNTTTDYSVRAFTGTASYTLVLYGT